MSKFINTIYRIGAFNQMVNFKNYLSSTMPLNEYNLTSFTRTHTCLFLQVIFFINEKKKTKKLS